MATVSPFGQSINQLLGFTGTCSNTWTAANNFGISKNPKYRKLSDDAKKALFAEFQFEAIKFIESTTNKKSLIVAAEPTPYADETVPEPTQTDSMSVQEQISEPETTRATKSFNKTKDKAIRGVEAKLVHIRTPDNVRKAVWLEPVFYEALERVTATRNKDKWLTDILVNVGDGNLASAVRCSIVKELLA